MNKKVWVGVLVGAIVLLLASKARAAKASVSVVSKMNKKLTDYQRTNALLIEQEFRKAGLPNNLIAAALVNAWAESKFNAASGTGDGGHSIGLFQLNDNGGAGTGLSVEYRLDPINNIRTILTREVLTDRGKELRKRAQEGAGVEELAGIFSRDIERPGDVQGAINARQALALTMFPNPV